MTIFDWYLLKLFFRIFLVCFISLSGFFVVVHVFTNLDEVVEITREIGGTQAMAQQFYLPRVCLFFDQTAPLLILAASVFAFTISQRGNEITALEAGGVSRARIVRPLFLGAILLIGASVVNREYVLPKHQKTLARNAQNYLGKKEMPMPFQFDAASGIVMRGKKILPAEKMIIEPEFQIPTRRGNAARSTRVTAEQATFRRQNRNHPAGYLVQGLAEEVTTWADPDQNGEQDSPIVYAADQYDWLNDDECFIACGMSTDQIVFGRRMSRYFGLPELIRKARNPSVEFNHYQRVEIHARMVRPAIDLSILLLGLPLVIARRDRNLFVAAGIGIGIVVLLQLVVLGFHTLGAMRMVNPAALAAWAPLIIFLPWALTAIRGLHK